jgi:hypothetical protein
VQALSHYRLDYTFKILQYIIIIYPHNLYTEVAQVCRPQIIVLDRRIMAATIQFDY